MQPTTATSLFAADIEAGLSANPKALSSKYFYDETGSRIFQAIMEMPEYYLTNAEYDIFKGQAAEILKAIDPEGKGFHLLEFGAGDGYKTKVLLKHFLEQKVGFDYLPIDISRPILDELEAALNAEMPELDVSPKTGEYFSVLEELSGVDTRQKVILFLGSNIGNFNKDVAIRFLSTMASKMNTGDKLLIGMDLKKDPHVILKAYNDPHGHTRDFNMNLLVRINRELGGRFRAAVAAAYS